MGVAINRTRDFRELVSALRKQEPHNDKGQWKFLHLRSSLAPACEDAQNKGVSADILKPVQSKKTPFTEAALHLVISF
jgi:hypothetical protein